MCDCVATESSVQTCPECLPVGAIIWLIENGRQLSLFEEPPEPVAVPGVDSFSEGDDLDGSCRPNPTSTDQDVLPDLPF